MERIYTMEVSRIFDILDGYKANYPEKEDVLARKEESGWIKYNIDDFILNCYHFSCGLLSLKLERGSRIVTLSNNRPAWNFADIGMMQAGFIHVPVYPTISLTEFEYIMNHCQPAMIIFSDEEIYNGYKECLHKLDLKAEIYSFSTIEGIKNWNDITNLGRKREPKITERLNKIKKEIKPDDVATIIYTSGTTGFSKGVVLTHQNLLFTAKTTARLIHLNETHSVLSFLPLCHVYERMMCYAYLINGTSIYYAEDTSVIGDYLKELKVNGFTTVPRLLEKVYDRILANGKDLPFFKRMIFFWAIKVGLKFRINEKRNLFYRMKLRIANRLIFSKWRSALGGNIIFIGVGGATLQKRLATIFWAAGLPVYEGYGLTETSPIICVNWGRYPNNAYPNIKIGTVGKVIKKVDFKIAKDGEILCKGPNLMLGYYNDEKSTNDVIDAKGWFHTGDVGSMDNDGFLSITDRKKEIFKTSGGKYIAPQLIENVFKESEFIEQLMVVGENKNFPGAIIVPDFTYLHSWAAAKKMKYRSNENLIQMPEVIEAFQHEIDRINQLLGQTEKIKKFALVHDEWATKTGELSPTLKLKRKILMKKYRRILKKMYQP